MNFLKEALYTKAFTFTVTISITYPSQVRHSRILFFACLLSLLPFPGLSRLKSYLFPGAEIH